jgi:cell division septation protein DedD
MSEREVERILGAPDYVQCVLNKEGDHFVGSSWQYEISVPQDLANSSQNSAIEILFGPDGKLKERNANMQAQPSPTPTPSAVATPIDVPPSPSTPAPAVTPTPSAAPAASTTPSPAPEVTPH